MKHVLASLCLVAVVFCAGTGLADGKGPVAVGSKIDTEGALLGQMIVLLLRDNGFDVNDKTEFGPTPIVRKAITSGELDIYPEYTGNGAFFFGGADPKTWRDAASAHQKVKELDYAKNKLVWMTPAPASNTWALAVRGDLAARENLETLGDFAEFVNQGGEVKLAGCEEFVTRDDALPAFQKAYGFKLSSDQLVVFSGCNTAQTEKAAARGVSGVNTAMAFGTDGALSALGLKVLQDTKNVQPVYQPTPVAREEITKEYPEIERILRPVFKSLDLETLQSLNSKIALGGIQAAKVAREYLESNGHL